jgi:hypothetical protein
MWSKEPAQRAAIALAFGMTAALSRCVLTTVESRLQMAAFIYAVAVNEWLAGPARGRNPSIAWALINAFAAIAAILAVRWNLEGLCPGVTRARCSPI